MIRDRIFGFLWNADGGGAGGSGGGAAGGAGGDGGAGGGAGGSGGAGGAGGGEGLADAARRIAAGDGGQSGQGGGQPNGQGGGQGGDGGQGGQGGASGPYYPEGLAEQLRGQSDRETIDKLFSEIKGQPGPPAKPDDYTLEMPPDVAKALPNLKDDPVVGMWRNIAHKHGLSQAQFQGAIVELYSEMERAGLIDPPIDFEKEVEKLMPEGIRDRKQALVAAAQRINRVADTVKDLHTRGIIGKEDVLVLSSMYATADAVKSFEKILNLIPREHGVQPGGNGAASYTKEDLERQMADPRYDSMSPSFDPHFRARVDNDWRRLMGASG